MTQSHDEAIARAARLIAGALSELTIAGQENSPLAEEVARSRIAMEALNTQIEQRLAEERYQRGLLTDQVTNLAGALDRLVTHLEGMSHLMSELIERTATPQVTEPDTTEAAPAAAEPSFQPGGEGVSLSIAAVPGFQALMDLQKALMGLEQVASASVERFQEGDSRIQVVLRSAITAGQLTSALGSATGRSFVVEESRPELMSLRLKIV